MIFRWFKKAKTEVNDGYVALAERLNGLEGTVGRSKHVRFSFLFDASSKTLFQRIEALEEVMDSLTKPCKCTADCKKCNGSKVVAK